MPAARPSDWIPTKSGRVESSMDAADGACVDTYYTTGASIRSRSR